jgi:CheY-like chemotaxis protein
MSNPATVLIVEDEFVIAELLEMALTDEGYRVIVAANGRQGLQRLTEGPLPDLIISDFMMPVLDGAGLVQAMQQNDGQRKVPIIIMSSMPEANVHARIESYAAFVRKPFQIAALMRLVATLLGVSADQDP